MKTTTAFLYVSGLVAVASFLALPGCSDETGGTTSTTGSSSSSSSSSGASSSSSSSSSGGPALTCADFCTAMEATCVDTNDKFTDAAACMAICATWPTGTLADTMGNTLGCRLYHAGVAGMAGMADAHCPHAGPFGEGQCGGHCDNFCALAMSACKGGDAAFPDEATCKTECMAFPKAAPGDEYSTTNTSGDSFGCRAYHLTAAVGMPAVHCAHIKTMSDTCK